MEMQLEVVIGIIAATLVRLSAFLIGYKIIRLGHSTLVQGIQGEFQFVAVGQGLKIGLSAAAPGLLFVFLGSAVICWSAFVEKPLGVEFSMNEAAEGNTPPPIPNNEITREPITMAGCSNGE